MKKKRKRNRKSIISFAAGKTVWFHLLTRHLKCTNVRMGNISARILGNTSLIELGHSLLILKWILEIGCTQ